MDKILPANLNFEHIIRANDSNTSNTSLSKNQNSLHNDLSCNKGESYLYDIISRINIINEEFYDYIIFKCGYKNASKEFKKEVRSYLDKLMVNYFKKNK